MNGQFKLNTRRWLAWGIGGLGFAGGSVSGVLVFYFGKKASEE